MTDKDAFPARLAAVHIGGRCLTTEHMAAGVSRIRWSNSIYVNVITKARR
jgi:hypothetical protein